MNLAAAKMLSNALSQYIANSDDLDEDERPADLALAELWLDHADRVIAIGAILPTDVGPAVDELRQGITRAMIDRLLSAR